MGHRLSAIVTRTGDDGSTGLGDGTRTGKDAPRIDALGEVDELNAHVGLLLAEWAAEGVAEAAAPAMTPESAAPAALSAPVPADLVAIQHALLDLGAELAVPGKIRFSPDRLERLEARIAQVNATLPPLREFILPGGTRAAAQAHVCRTVCRRAERSIVRLARTEPVSEPARRYINRLSDWFFVLARAIQRESGGAEPQWEPVAGNVSS